MEIFELFVLVSDFCSFQGWNAVWNLIPGARFTLQKSNHDSNYSVVFSYKRQGRDWKNSFCGRTIHACVILITNKYTDQAEISWLANSN